MTRNCWTLPRGLSLVVLVALALSSCTREGCSPNQELGDSAQPEARHPGDRSPLESRPLRDDYDVIDPYCGMKLRLNEAAATARFRGKTYHFCMSDHRSAFLVDPARYVSGGDVSLDGGLGDGGADAGPAAQRK